MALKRKPPIFAINIPNILTVLRILLTPLFVILLLKQLYLMALGVFFAAGVSDGLDGFIARYFNQRTIMGAYLDPVADKLLLTASYVCLAVLGLIPAWLSVVVISRDVLIVLGIALLTFAKIDFEVQPSRLSKSTTFMQLFTILIILLAQEFPRVGEGNAALFWMTATITIISGLHYLYVGLNILQDALGNSHSSR